MKKKSTCIGLCCLGFIGLGGMHDFYLHRYGIGTLKLLTMNFFIIGTFVDLFKLSKEDYYYFKTLKNMGENTESNNAPNSNYNSFLEDDELDDEEEQNADTLYLRVERTMGLKTERAVSKGIITSEEAKMLSNELNNVMSEQSKQYWLNIKGKKSFEVCLELLENSPMLETLKKIEKA